MPFSVETYADPMKGTMFVWCHLGQYAVFPLRRARWGVERGWSGPWESRKLAAPTPRIWPAPRRRGGSRFQRPVERVVIVAGLFTLFVRPRFPRLTDEIGNCHVRADRLLDRFVDFVLGTGWADNLHHRGKSVRLAHFPSPIAASMMARVSRLIAPSSVA